MANITVTNTDGIKQLFSSLSGVLSGGDPNALIQADLARTQRGKLLAETGKTNAELAVIQRQEAAMRDLADMLSDPTLAQTPEGRASLISILSGVKDGLQYGPGFATGASVFTNPDVFNDKELSNVGFATGVAPNYSNSPSGLADTLASSERENAATIAGNYEEAILKEQGDTLRKGLELSAPGGGGSRAPLDISLADAEKIGERVDQLFATTYSPGAAINPQLKQAVVARAAELYQQTRNSEAAIQQAFSDFNMTLQKDTTDWWNPLTWVTGQDQVSGGLKPDRGPVTPPQQPMTPVLPGPSAPGAPSVFAQPDPGPTAPPAVSAPPASNHPTVIDGDLQPPAPDKIQLPPGVSVGAPIPGMELPDAIRTIARNADGTYSLTAPDGTVRPLVNGQTVRSRSNGQTLIFINGQWYPATLGTQ